MAELTVEEKLRELFELQLVDSQIDEIQILKGELPDEVQDLEDDIAGLELRMGKMDSNIKELQSEVSNQQAKIKESEASILRYQTQLENVKNSREFDALTKELEFQKLEIQLAEKRARQAKIEIENKEETFKATDERLQKKRKELESKKAELAQIIEKTEQDEDELRKKSEEARKNIEERLIKAYDKIRTSYRNGLAVVTVERDSCGGCFNKIPPQLQLEIGMRKHITACEHCGRILVDDGIVSEVKERVGVLEA
ncbi:MAG: C4-type zinc ribbon domain-containing protein [Saprospiraceae bacterium]|nr:C4-type zinc ribbon domain-containing protein [Saprospiraceae bacterium]